MFKVIIYLLLGIILSLYLSLNGINSLSLSLLYIYIYFSLTHSLCLCLSLSLSVSLSLSLSLSLYIALSFSIYYSFPVCDADNFNSNTKIKRERKIIIFYYVLSLSQVERVDIVKRRRGNRNLVKRRRGSRNYTKSSFYATPSSPPTGSSPLPPEPSGTTNENVKVYRIVYYLLFFFNVTYDIPLL